MTVFDFIMIFLGFGFEFMDLNNYKFCLVVLFLFYISTKSEIQIQEIHDANQNNSGNILNYTVEATDPNIDDDLTIRLFEFLENFN
jgi:hypothetical protein